MFTKGMLLTTVSIAAISCIASGAVAAERQRPVTHMRGAVHRVISSSPGSVTLYDQNSDDAGVAVLSTNFTDDFDSYDSYGADDFAVPTGHKWTIREVDVMGEYLSGSKDPGETESLSFYRDKKGFPGKPLAECDDVKGQEEQGSFAIRLPKTCNIVLGGGAKYWISVAANMEFQFGDWGWQTRSTPKGEAAAWENPNGGFGRCATWETMTACIGDDGEGPDFMFTLKGKDVVTR